MTAYIWLSNADVMNAWTYTSTDMLSPRSLDQLIRGITLHAHSTYTYRVNLPKFRKMLHLLIRHTTFKIKLGKNM